MMINRIGGIDMNKKYVKPQIITKELLLHDRITASGGEDDLNEVAAGTVEDTVDFGLIDYYNN